MLGTLSDSGDFWRMPNTRVRHGDWLRDAEAARNKSLGALSG